MDKELCASLLEYKAKIKRWELLFLQTHERKPDKSDIATAPQNVKESYKKYWMLKKKEGIRKDSSNQNIDDVWSEKLNKAHEKILTQPPSNENLNKFCNKLKKQNISLKKTPSQVHRKETLNKNKDLTSCSPEDLSFQCNLPENSDMALDADFPSIEFKSKKTNFAVFSPHMSLKKLKNINVLSPTVNSGDKKRLSHFQTNINSDWLERCNTFNSPKLTEDEHSTTIKKQIPEERDMIELHLNNDTDTVSSKKAVSALAEESCTIEPHLNNDIDTVASVISTTRKYEESLTGGDQIPSEFLNCNNVTIDCKDDATDFRHNTEALQNGCTNIAQKHFVDNKISIELIETEKCLKLTETEKITTAVNPVERCRKRKFSALSQIDSSPAKITAQEENIQKLDVKINTKKISSNNCDKITSGAKLSNQSAHLKKKMAAGTINENFVRLNIKKKKFCRGHKQINVKKMKWNKWKQLKKDNHAQSDMPTKTGCFKCGQIGHWARNCTSNTGNNKLLPEIENLDDVPLPTLEEAADLAKGLKSNLYKSNLVKIFQNAELQKEIKVVNQIPNTEEVTADEAMKGANDIKIVRTVKPIYNVLENKMLVDTPDEVFKALHEMGHSEFRTGQEKAVMRILSGLSTLVVLPTGSGKSLCYQLPAYLYAKHYQCLTLVISPLVSLMEDQVTGLASCITAIRIHSGMTPVEKENALKDLSSGKVHILLVSPEAVIGGYRGLLPAEMPPIAFACIDEAHCLSQWSHNFRPSYLQVFKVLKRKFGVKCILGLTATATQSTVAEVVESLELKSVTESVVGHTNVPHNLLISVSRDKDKDRALIQLLNGDRFKACHSIIIYCIRRDETERLATLIRTSMQDTEHSDETLLLEENSKKKKSSKKKCTALECRSISCWIISP